MKYFWEGFYWAEDVMYRELGWPPFWEWPWLHIVVLIYSALAIRPAYRLWRHPPKEMGLRPIGVDKASYAQIVPLARLATLEAVVGAVLAIILIFWPHVAPWPLDLIVFLALVGSGYMLFRRLRSRATFKSPAFARKVFVPLGLSLVAALPGTLRTISKTPKAGAGLAKVAGVGDVGKFAKDIRKFPIVRQLGDSFDDAAKATRALFDDALDVVGEAVSHRRNAKTVAGPYTFVSRTALGGVGEGVSVRHYEAMGLKYYKSQVGANGMDAVFAKYGNNGDLLEVYVVESKVNTSRLCGDQMSDEWIRQCCQKALKKSDTRQAARLVERAMEPGSEVVLHRHLIHTDVDTGVGTLYSVAKSGEVATTRWSGDVSGYIKEVIADMERKGSCWRVPAVEVAADIR
jgi:hypothetical protein